MGRAKKYHLHFEAMHSEPKKTKQGYIIAMSADQNRAFVKTLDETFGHVANKRNRLMRSKSKAIN